jgi:Na+/H+ antiporter NhaD/arsenite permease-like protein
MELSQLIIAGAGTLLVATRPRSWAATGAAATLAATDVALLSAPVGAALSATAPMAAVLCAAVVVAGLTARVGLPVRLAGFLATAARDSASALLALVVAVTALLTALLTLDGAVVVMAPVVASLARRARVSLPSLVLVVVAVANAFSLALPEANPTNLVVMHRLGLAPWETPARTVLPATAATLLCVAAVAWAGRRERGGAVPSAVEGGEGLPTAFALVLAGRACVQVASLLVVLLPVARDLHPAAPRALGSLIVVALACSTLAALANNLPASALVAVSVGAGPAAYAALAGLSIGALATPHGSVATLLAYDLAGVRRHSRALAAASVLAVCVATLMIWAGARL